MNRAASIFGPNFGPPAPYAGGHASAIFLVPSPGAPALAPGIFGMTPEVPYVPALAVPAASGRSKPC